MTDFAHLHVHSEYSLLDGYARVEDLVRQAQEHGSPALALTDHGVMYAAIDFYKACKDAGIAPIIGVEAYVAPNSRLDKRPKIDTSPYHLVLLAKDQVGYRNLIELTTRAHTEGFYYKPRIDRELLAKHSQGLICLSACLAAEVPRLVRQGDLAGAREAAAWHRDVFGPENYYLELQEHEMAEQTESNRGVMELARALDLSLVATNDVHYVRPEDMRGQELLLCIQTNSTIDDPNRMRMGTNSFYLRSPAEMARLFAEVPAALANTVRVAEQCSLKLDFNRLHLPDFDLPAGFTVDTYLEHLCREGLTRRLSTITAEYEQRLAYELGVITQTGFAHYILIVWDIFAYARRRGIIAGPRGSAAGALVLFLLGISDVDPVKHKLTFERFLNPERAEMPDVDMDFADDRRDEMINYVTEKYGREHVAQIITFGTLGAKAAIRDTGRALGVPFGDVDRVAKLVPTLPVGMTIDGAIEANPALRQLVREDESVKKLLDDARRVEGFARHASTHAAGVVIARDPLTEYTPLQPTSRSDTNLMTQYNADNLAKIGLLKMDFLGLSNLTILGRAVEIIERERGVRLDLLAIPEDDPRTFELFAKGETVGLFQLEGRGMTAYLRELKPTSIDDVTAMIALYRPGPMANIPQYIARKNGIEAVSYPHPLLEDILADTYGVLTYQDQVLQVLRKVAGYTLGQADIVRKAMGKKIRSLMEKEKVRFGEGCRENGLTVEECDELWNLLEPFSGYGFNRAHAACYAQIAYQTAYLKANYPVEFMVAVLSTFRDNSDKVTGAVLECRRMGIEVLPPDVNRSLGDFAVEPRDGRPAIRFGLAAIKNVGEGAAQPIVDAVRKDGAFRGVEDFTRRVNLRGLNKRVLESLVKAGALDPLGANRGQLLAALDRMIGIAQQAQRAQEAGQSSMFDLLPAAEVQVSIVLPDTPEVPDREKLEWEKELLGVYFSEHPMTKLTRRLWDQRAITHFCNDIVDEPRGTSVTLAGIVASVRQIVTRKRDQMCSAMVEDASGSVEMVVFPRTYAETRELWREGAILLVEGKIDQRDERHQIVVDSARPYDESGAVASIVEELGPAEVDRSTVESSHGGGTVAPAAPSDPTNGGSVQSNPTSDRPPIREVPDAPVAASRPALVPPGLSREQVVIGPQNRGAATAPTPRVGRRGRPDREPDAPPPPSGPPRLARLTVKNTGDDSRDSSVLVGMLDLIERSAGGIDEVRVRVQSRGTIVELRQPELRVRWTSKLRREIEDLGVGHLIVEESLALEA